MEQPKSLTHTQSGALLAISIVAFVAMLILKQFVTPEKSGLLAMFFLVLLYLNVPSGRGTLDFKIGLILGAMLAILAYDVLMGFTFLAR